MTRRSRHTWSRAMAPSPRAPRQAGSSELAVALGQLMGRDWSGFNFDRLAAQLTLATIEAPNAWAAELRAQELLYAAGCNHPLSYAAKLIDGPLARFARAAS